VAADPLDLLTIDEAKQWLAIGVSDETKTSSLEMAITACSRKIAANVGPIITGTVTAELHDGGDTSFFLRQTPVYSVTQVVEYDATVAATLTAESNTSQTINQYQVNTNNGKITRRETNTTARFPTGMNNVSVSYVSGRYLTTATVDDRYKEACGIMLRNVWRPFEQSVGQVDQFDVPQSNFPRFAVPNAVKELLADQWRSGSGFVG
jgi:hypothetical protein